MDKVFSLKKTLKILENGNKCWKSQGSLSIQKSENHGEGNVFTPKGHSDSRGGGVWCHFLPGCLVPCSFREGLHPWGRGSPSRMGYGTTPPPMLTFSGGHQSGRYASYWNAFLLNLVSVVSVVLMKGDLSIECI